MAYITYEYYVQNYGGAEVDETSFSPYENKSRLQIDRYTFNRVRYAVEDDPNFCIPEDIKLAQCALIDYMKSFDDDGGRIIASETVSKHTEHYAGVKTYEEECRGIVKKYLGGTSWTYLGGGAGREM